MATSTSEESSLTVSPSFPPYSFRERLAVSAGCSVIGAASGVIYYGVRVKLDEAFGGQHPVASSLLAGTCALSVGAVGTLFVLHAADALHGDRPGLF